ncbi:hypothetical protein [Variovorax sp. PAMC 28711]|uniref:hypothetical protein n=1 Tax=Variovorax sp. PAMC 28711 TaxID=1795631 RepID=UPI000AB1C99D|nr:hypothetical protein [Variovorax sp. PAMC 28711]
MKIKKRILVLALIAVLALGEAAVQLSGMVDFPIYMADKEIGYIPAPNQSGSFLRSHDWRFNEFSMGAGPFKPDSNRFNVLLIGDSLVLGGNPISEEDRLGPQLEKLTNWQVWPISAGSWALQNELTYLKQHRDLLEKIDAIIWLSNSGDFDEPSSWASEMTHPRHHPFPGIIYLAKKYLLKERPQPSPSQLKVAKREWRNDFNEVAEKFNKPIYLFLYPDIGELKAGNISTNRLNALIPDIEKSISRNVRIFKVADSVEWTPALYRDEIHPSRDGNTVLDKIFYSNICNQNTLKTICK